MCSVGRNKSDFYELSQEKKQLKTMEMREVLFYIYNEGYTHQFQFKPIQTNSTNSPTPGDAPNLKISSHETSLK